MSWFLLALQKYAVFGGRSRRREYWYFLLFYTLAFVALVLLDVGLGTYYVKADVGLFSGIYALAMVVPNLSAAARRLHDIGKSGWWQLIVIVPFIGVLVLIAFLIRDSQPITNQYGPSPKAAN